MTWQSRGRPRWDACFGAGLASLVLAAAPACDSSPPTLPADLPGYLDIPPSPFEALGDERRTVECRTVSVTIGEYLHIDPLVEHLGRDWSRCNSTYLLDFSVESDAGEAMLLDFLRPYDIYDWQVHASGDRVRHDLRVFWKPHYNSRPRAARLSLGWRPLTIPVCPEGERGPVLACWDGSCGLYDREEQVSEVVSDALGMELSTPWGFEDSQRLYEGETLEIPLTYVVHRDQPSYGNGKIRLDFALNLRDSSRPPRVSDRFDYSNVVELSPREIELRGLREGDSDTLLLRLTAKPNDVEQTPSLFIVSFRATGIVPQCVAQANDVQVWVHDRP